MVYKASVKITKSLKGRYQNMKNITGPRDIAAIFDVEIFSFTGADPVSFGVCADVRARGVF
jgi:hypothetical protein